MPFLDARDTSLVDRNWAAETFLVLFAAGAGCLLGGLILDPAGASGRFAVAYSTVALFFAAVGAIAPLSRIKKPLRAYRMLSGIGRSALSRQAALVGLFLVLAAVLWVLVLGGRFVFWVAVLAAVVGVAGTLASGYTYFLRSQPAWRHWSNLTERVSGVLALGSSTSLLLALGWQQPLLGRSGNQIAAVVLALVGVCGLWMSAWGWGRRPIILSILVVAGAATVLSLLSPWVMVVTFVGLLAALFAWRSVFFLSVSSSAWRREIRRTRPRVDGRDA